MPPLSEFSFDAVLFDLDGTLVATDRFWPDAARAGAVRAFAELGLERALPTRAEWMGMVGLGVEDAFEQVFPDLEHLQRTHVLRRCLEEEAQALRAGNAALLPGVELTLKELARRGVRTGIASNCGLGYLDAMLTGLGLERWIHAALCLDSPGVADKAGMIDDLLLTFGTRSAVMVGDRRGDRDAAWANGLPHVHLTRGYAELDESVPCEAQIEGMDELIGQLEGRERALARVARRIDSMQPGDVLGVTGGVASGKTLFARDLVRSLAAAGRRAGAVDLEQYERSGEPAGLADDPLEFVRQRYELERLTDDVFAPRAAGEEIVLPDGTRLAPEDVVVLEGPCLQHPDLRSRLGPVLHLEVSEEVARRRIAGRDAHLDGPLALARFEHELLPRQRWMERLWPPAPADVVLDGDNPLELVELA